MNRFRSFATCLLAICGACALLSTAAAQQRPARFIVMLDPNSQPETIAREHGIAPDFMYHSAIRGFAGPISDLARAGLLGDARVHRIEPDTVATAADVEINPPWGLDRIDQRALPLDSAYTYSGDAAGVTVYILDTGIRYSHSEFGGRASFGFDTFGGDGNDCHGHGTHNAGIAGGATYGVAKGVNLVSVRVLGCDATGTASGVIAGIDWVTAHHAPLAVANISIQSTGINSAVDTAIHNMMVAGVVTVVSAGNKNDDACKYSYARVTNAMTTASTISTDARDPHSSYGSCVDWFAPGNSILSAWNTDDNASRVTSGTSNAAPYVAGAAAIYLKNHPGSSQIQTRDALLSFTTKGIVSGANTPNNHLLYNLEIQDGSGDYVSPVTAITAPANGATVARNQTVSIQASATDNGGLGFVARVEFYVNGVLTCMDTALPYACSWRVPNSRGATYLLQSTAFDAAGNAQASPFVSVVAQ